MHSQYQQPTLSRERRENKGQNPKLKVPHRIKEIQARNMLNKIRGL
jgi:hypothetical protein